VEGLEEAYKRNDEATLVITEVGIPKAGEKGALTGAERNRVKRYVLRSCSNREVW
jgi:hypothetical protein